MSNLARTLVMTTFALGLSATAAFAQGATSATAPSAAQETTQAAPNHADLRADKAMTSADKDCIRNTGTHIRRKAGQCLPVAGRSYSGKELRSTGQIDTGRALQMLDPSVTLGH